jgi:methyl-accepting chemotaxis protein
MPKQELNQGVPIMKAIRNFSFKNLQTRAKLFVLVGFITLVAIISGGGTVFNTLTLFKLTTGATQATEYQDLNRQAYAFLLQAGSDTKDFLLTQDVKYLEQGTANLRSIAEIADTILSRPYYAGKCHEQAIAIRELAIGYLSELSAVASDIEAGHLVLNDEFRIQFSSRINESFGESGVVVNAGISEGLRQNKQAFGDISGLLDITLKMIVGMVPLAVIIVIMLGLWIVRLITVPIAKLSDGIKTLGDGDLTVKVDVNTQDEIGQMGRAFNDSVDQIRLVMRQVGKTSSQVNTAATQISTTAEQQAAGSEEQQAQLSEVATTMEEMSAMILEASRSTDATQSDVSSAGSTAQEGRAAVAKTVDSYKTVVATVGQAVNQIEELNTRSEEIGNVIQVIDDIADQTNLLALNANIEAARAGDAGRGFAVVADEVRKLAERTVNATSEIGMMIGTIQKDIGSAVLSMKEIQELSNDGLSLVSESDTALQEISSAVSSVSNSVEQIAASSNEQSTGVEQVSKNVESVSTVAKEGASAAQELAASAEQLAKEVKSLNSYVGTFKIE